MPRKIRPSKFKSAKNDWWKNTVIYQVYLPSFNDEDNDGIGDIPGLVSRLEYFSSLSIKTILLSPFYPSPMKDNGFDISDYVDVDPQFGSVEDFDCLMTKIQEKGMHLLLNFVPNHTSDHHEWFKKSVQNIEPYSSYYIWADPKKGPDGRKPPNNWISCFNGSAWTWNEQRQKYYLHQFLPEQPDLNLRNPYVKEELQKVLTFWLDKGVDGFRVDAASHLFENEELLDEPVHAGTTAEVDEYDYLDHVYTKGHRENLDIIREWRKVLNVYTERTGKYKLLITEVCESHENTILYYGSVLNPVSDMPLNMDLLQISDNTSAQELYDIIHRWMQSVPDGKYPNWMLGSHDHARLASRVGMKLLDGLHMLAFLMKGTVFCYYGDELGMENTPIDKEDMKDSFALRTSPENSRDPSRTPMQWSDEANAGFSKCPKPWLPLHPDWTTINVKVQNLHANSHLEIFKKLVELKLQPAIQFGIQEYPLVTSAIFSMARVFPGERSYLIVLNMSNSECIANFTAQNLPEVADIVVTNMVPSSDEHLEKNLRNMKLCPKESIVLSFFSKNCTT